MKRYERKFKESHSSATELAVEIQREIEKIFPNCYVNVKFGTNFYPAISIKFMLGTDKSEWANGIHNNDIAHIHLSIEGKGGRELPKDGNIEGMILQMDASQSSFTIKPPKGSHLAYGRVKIPFRKPSGDGKKMVDYVKKYFMTAKKLFQTHQDDMPEHLFSLLKNKKF